MSSISIFSIPNIKIFVNTHQSDQGFLNPWSWNSRTQNRFNYLKNPRVSKYPISNIVQIFFFLSKISFPKNRTCPTHARTHARVHFARQNVRLRVSRFISLINSQLSELLLNLHNLYKLSPFRAKNLPRIGVDSRSKPPFNWEPVNIATHAHTNTILHDRLLDIISPRYFSRVCVSLALVTLLHVKVTTSVGSVKYGNGLRNRGGSLRLKCKIHAAPWILPFQLFQPPPRLLFHGQNPPAKKLERSCVTAGD